MNRINTLTGAAGFLAGVLLTGCATMDEDECRSANWIEQGTRDGERGRKRETIDSHIKACREFGVKADVQGYRRGWDQGIQQYCTSDKGWEVGMSDWNYNHSCPKQLEAEFYSAYQMARSVKESKTAVDTARADLDKVLEELAENDLSDEQRKSLKKDKKRLKKALASAKSKETRVISEARKMGFPI